MELEVVFGVKAIYSRDSLSDESRLDRLVFHEDYLSRECG